MVKNMIEKLNLETNKVWEEMNWFSRIGFIKKTLLETMGTEISYHDIIQIRRNGAHKIEIIYIKKNGK